MTEDRVEIDSGLQSPEVENRWDIFYPGIENNMIFVHGTSTAWKRNQILESGLEPPKDYFIAIENSYYKGKETDLKKLLIDHCMPGNFYNMEYDDFLKERRKLIAKSVRSVFESL